MAISRNIADIARAFSGGSRGLSGLDFGINGGFNHWQRGVSFTGNGYGPDRWYIISSGTTKTFSRQAFGLGQSDVPGNPQFFLRASVTSVAGVSSYALMAQRLEGVRSLAGRRCTILFWAKADAAKNIAIELFQRFGTGGSPSADVGGIGSQLVPLTTAWAPYALVVDVPSISGKVLGTDGQDHLGVHFWFDAGSNFNSRAANLGQQSGVFDIANVMIVEGDARGLSRVLLPRPASQDLPLALRFYQQVGEGCHGHAHTTSAVRIAGNFVAPMRTIQSFALLRTSFNWLQNNSVLSLTGASISFMRHDSMRGFRAGISNTGVTTLTVGAPGQYYEDNAPLIEFDAEL